MAQPEPIRVLVVDDEHDMRRLFRLALDYDERFDVIGDAVDGVTAVEAAVALVPEAIVLDWAMPRLSSGEAIRGLKLAAPACKVVVVSAYDRSEIADEAEAAGADAYLDKPNAAATLAGVLLRICREEVDLREETEPAPIRGPEGR